MRMCEHRDAETFYLDNTEAKCVRWCPECGSLSEDGKWREPRRRLLWLSPSGSGAPAEVRVGLPPPHFIREK